MASVVNYHPNAQTPRRKTPWGSFEKDIRSALFRNAPLIRQKRQFKYSGLIQACCCIKTFS